MLNKKLVITGSLRLQLSGRTALRKTGLGRLDRLLAQKHRQGWSVIGENGVQRAGVENVVGPSFKLIKRSIGKAGARFRGQWAKAARELAFEHGGFALLHAFLHALLLPFLRPLHYAFGKHVVDLL